MRSGITRRWLRGSLLITVLLVLLVEVMFLYSATRSYYNGVQQTMYRRFSSITGQLKMYTGETSQKTAASRSVALRRMVEQFSDKDKYEFMLLDSYGGVIASSSGTDAEGIVTRTDFEQAQDAVDGQGIAIYRTQSGEMVMAACCLVPYAAEDVAAMRLVTSLTLVEEQLKRTVVVALIMGAAGGRGAPSAWPLPSCRACTSCGASWCRWDRWSAPPPASPGVSWMSVCPSPATSGMRWTACAALSTEWPRASKRRKR